MPSGPGSSTGAAHFVDVAIGRDDRFLYFYTEEAEMDARGRGISLTLVSRGADFPTAKATGAALANALNANTCGSAESGLFYGQTAFAGASAQRDVTPHPGADPQRDPVSPCPIYSGAPESGGGVRTSRLAAERDGSIRKRPPSPGSPGRVRAQRFAGGG